MPTKGLTETSVKVLTWMVYALMALLSLISAWNVSKINTIQSNLPKDYVLNSYYRSDQVKLDKTLASLDSKLNQLLMCRWQAPETKRHSK